MNTPTQSTQDREAALFAMAIEVPLGDRPAFLEVVCGKDGALRERLEALLAANDEPDPLLSDAARKPTVKATSDSTARTRKKSSNPVEDPARTSAEGEGLGGAPS